MNPPWMRPASEAAASPPPPAATLARCEVRVYI